VPSCDSPGRATIDVDALARVCTQFATVSSTAQTLLARVRDALTGVEQTVPLAS
jgi:hypothetical protein